MNYSQDGRYMERPTLQAGSVRRARELAEARAQPGGGRRDFSSIPVPQMQRAMESNPQLGAGTTRRTAQAPPAIAPSKIPRPQAPVGLQDKNGQITIPISRPTQVPQWPLAGPLASPPGASGSQPYRPPPGRSQAPQRPPRPSRVPSMLDSSKVQDHTPVFQYTPQTGRESGPDMSGVPPTPSTNASRPSTQSSVGTIPDFPVPSLAPNGGLGPPRRSVGLGPPPSSRRGASSFYSNASYVSPIPEESPRTRSNASYASSAAMPTSFGSQSPAMSPRSADGFYEDVIPEEVGSGGGEEDGDESRLVRSASIGKRGKALLVTTTTTRASDTEEVAKRPAPSPIQTVTSFLDGSSSSSGTVPTVKTPVGGALTADSILNAYNAASAVDPSNPMPSPQPPSRPYSRLSAIRRPPRLDIDAVRKAESRGSLTSLPDLIRRATQLAASLERGRRPASRFDNLDDFPMPSDPEKEDRVDPEKHQSGLSDMLAAFPPPAQAANRRQSFRPGATSWPLPVNFLRGQSASTPRDEDLSPRLPTRPPQRRRRCCGLPMWGFFFVLLVIVILIVAAIVIPLEFFVFHKQNTSSQSPQPALSQCQNQVTCENGGTNVVNDNVCSCICTNGFTGSDCTISGASGCTTTSFTGTDNLDNVTLGDALPRLVQQAQSNFSIPLSATNIISKLNSGNLSCIAQDALVTFDGENSREGDASAEVTDPAENANGINAFVPTVANGVLITTITIMAGQGTTFTLFTDQTTAPTTPPASVTNNAGTTAPVVILTPTSTTTVTTTITPGSAASPSPTFTVTEEVLDFARVAVLFILQQNDLNSAEAAQGTLQSFFTSASEGSQRKGAGVSIDSARNVTIGGSNSVDLVNFRIDNGSLAVGGSGAA